MQRATMTAKWQFVPNHDCALLHVDRHLPAYTSKYNFGDKKLPPDDALLVRKILAVPGVVAVRFSDDYEVHVDKGVVFPWGPIQAAVVAAVGDRFDAEVELLPATRLVNNGDRIEEVAEPAAGAAQLLTLAELSGALRKRCEAQDGFKMPLDAWSLSEYITAMTGELGEAANLVKKLNRSAVGARGNTVDDDELRKQLGSEVCDSIAYHVLFLLRLGLDVEQAVRDNFDAKSAEIEYPGRLEAGPSAPASATLTLAGCAIESAGWSAPLQAERVVARLGEKRIDIGRLHGSPVSVAFCLSWCVRLIPFDIHLLIPGDSRRPRFTVHGGSASLPASATSDAAELRGVVLYLC